MVDHETRASELLVRDVVAAIANTTTIERLPVAGEPTADWRVTLANGRTADVEATQHEVAGVSRFWSQMREKPGPEWPDKRLSHSWTVLLSEPTTTHPQQPVRLLIEKLVPILVEIEAVERTPTRMLEMAKRRLIEHGLDRWSDTEHRIRLRTAPEPRAVADGGVNTLGNFTHGVSWGSEALKSAIQESVAKKTKKDQMPNAPDLRWLAVMLTGGHPLSQFEDSFGPYAHEPYNFDALGDINFDYFDEVWLIGPANPSKYAALRVSRSPVLSSRHVIRSPAS